MAQWHTSLHQRTPPRQFHKRCQPQKFKSARVCVSGCGQRRREFAHVRGDYVQLMSRCDEGPLAPVDKGGTHAERFGADAIECMARNEQASCKLFRMRSLVAFLFLFSTIICSPEMYQAFASDETAESISVTEMQRVPARRRCGGGGNWATGWR